jgi:ATP-dependent DNA helicase RecQ
MWAAMSRPAPSSTPDALGETLRRVFGYDAFRPGQREVIEAVLAGREVLAVMPTGSGKSMCYQLPALVAGGLTVVVSPLIALMRDQVRQLAAQGVAAATLNSASTEEEARAAWAGIGDRSLRLLFVSPERLGVKGLASRLRAAGANRLAIDEAHCVSQWGHDFRPDYRDLPRMRAAMGDPPVIALTATADASTRADIARTLFPRPPESFVHSFDRPNIALRFEAKDGARRQILEFVGRRRGRSGIVYCASRSGTERLAEALAAEGHNAFAYHAGLDQARRNANQDRFLREDGAVVAATIAFGMGINKPDVRFVVHADMPGAIESWYQEIGRAGRDGLPAETLTLYGLEDIAFRRRQIAEKDLGDERRAIEDNRLSAMIGLCEATGCRREMLLAYFGEAMAAPCVGCRGCGGAGTFDATVEAQKVLSAILRTGERFGAGHIADVLTGTPSETVKRLGHDGVKTFGAGRDHDRRTWMGIVRQLLGRGLIEANAGERPTFRVSDRGLEALRGRESVTLREEAARTRPARRRDRAEAPAAGGEDDRLLAALKRLRRELADEQGVPAYVIFADRSLIDMIDKRPRTLSEMADVHGVGAQKLKLYGEAFLEALQAGE